MNRLLKVVTAALHLVGTLVLLVIVFLGFLRYQRSESKAIIEINMPSENMPIVAFSVCPAYQHAYRDKKLKEHDISKRSFQSDFNFTVPAGGMTVRQTFEDITYDFNELVETVGVGLRKLAYIWEFFNLTNLSQDGFISG